MKWHRLPPPAVIFGTPWQRTGESAMTVLIPLGFQAVLMMFVLVFSVARRIERRAVAHNRLDVKYHASSEVGGYVDLIVVEQKGIATFENLAQGAGFPASR